MRKRIDVTNGEKDRIVVGEPEFVEEGVIFRLGGKSVLIPKALTLLFADKGMLESAFQNAARPDEDFADIEEPIAVFAKIVRLLGHGLDHGRIAKLLAMDPDKCRKFYGWALNAYRAHQGAQEELKKQAAEDYLPAAAPLDRTTGLAVGPKTVKHILAQDVLRAFAADLGETDLAARWGVSAHDLRAWMDRNQDILNALKRKSS
jgi:hypothetical protein